MGEDIYGGVFDHKLLADLGARAQKLRSALQSYPIIRLRANLLRELVLLCQRSIDHVAATGDDAEFASLQTATELLISLTDQVHADQYELLRRLQCGTPTESKG